MGAHQYLISFLTMYVLHFDKDILVCNMAQWTGVLVWYHSIL